MRNSGALFLILLLLVPSLSAAERRGRVISGLCPLDCRTKGIESRRCRDWRIADTCYVEIFSRRESSPPSSTLVLCSNASGAVTAKSECREGETRLTAQMLQGVKGDSGEKGLPGETGLQGEKGDRGDAGEQGPIGPTGPQGEKGATGEQGPVGPTGSQGIQGEDGAFRIYGDQSAGSRIISSSTIFSDPNPQYENFTINAGAALTVYAGTIIRCRGSFENNGTILVSAVSRNTPKFADNGEAPTDGPYSNLKADGGSGGRALADGVARNLLRPGLLGGGDGNRSDDTATGGQGGGNVVILCQGTVVNKGEILADAQDADDAVGASGGGGGGLVVLASATEVINEGVISATGGDGSDLIQDRGGTGYAAGGGGGGGIIHLVAPSIINTGTTDYSGGSGGAAGGPNSLTAVFKVGGGGGGGSGGQGGAGGTANPLSDGDGSSTAGESGDSGKLLLTQADPAGLF